MSELKISADGVAEVKGIKPENMVLVKPDENGDLIVEYEIEGDMSKLPDDVLDRFVKEIDVPYIGTILSYGYEELHESSETEADDFSYAFIKKLKQFIAEELATQKREIMDKVEGLRSGVVDKLPKDQDVDYFLVKARCFTHNQTLDQVLEAITNQTED